MRILQSTFFQVTYATVTHDQHALENVVVFEFHEHSHHEDDHAPEHEREHEDHWHADEHDESSDNLSLILTIIIAVMSVLTVCGLAVYAYLKWTTYRRKQKNRSRGDMQELTTQVSSISR